MRRPLLGFSLLSIVLLAGLALAITPVTVQRGRWQFAGGAILGTAAASGVITESLYTTTTIDFASTTVGSADSSNITLTGAAVGDQCQVMPPAAAAALKANFSCYVTAADTVVVRFAPEAKSKAQVALVSGTPSTQTATVIAGSICTATPVGATAAIAAGGIATGVSSTTLTLTGPNTVTTTVTYDCAAPVDPASGSYIIRTWSGT